MSYIRNERPNPYDSSLSGIPSNSMECGAEEKEGWRPHARKETIDWDPYSTDMEWKEAISVTVRFRDVIPRHQEVRYEKACHRRE